METQNATQTCISAKTLGQMLSLSKRQIFRLHSCGKLPKPLKIGGSIRWKMADISIWQDMNCPDRREFETRKAGAGK